MSEPVDHRAAAEGWLSKADVSVNEGAAGFAQAEALIGIGHALLAWVAEPPEGECTWDLPPKHEHNWVNIGQYGDPEPNSICADCGEQGPR
jgi:hypothetical protein